MMTASIRNNQLNLLARRSGYNLALRHFRTAQEFAADVGDGYNLADVLNAALREEQISEFQIRPIISVLLNEKFGYACGSENLKEKVEDIKNLSKVLETWTNIQVILVYSDTNDGIHILNPLEPDSWSGALPLAKDEHIVCYAGAVKDVKDGVLESAVGDVFTLLYGGKVRAKTAYRSVKTVKKQIKPERAVSEQEAEYEAPAETRTVQAPAPEAAAPAAGGSRKLTAKIAVNVTNELFHNGNVEAWKRIIESYKHVNPALDGLIWYEGERINDINALFKWGKVKHGVPILFSVAGENPRDLAKLRKYLFEGASQRFEAFLHGAPGSILQLF